MVQIVLKMLIIEMDFFFKDLENILIHSLWDIISALVLKFF